MPIKYKASSGGNFVYATGSGHLCPEEVFEYLNEITRDASVNPGFKEIVDVRPIDSAGMTPDDIKKVRDLIVACPKRSDQHRLAIIVKMISSFANAFYLRKLAKGQKDGISVFTDEDSAWAWLGLESREIDYVDARHH